MADLKIVLSWLGMRQYLDRLVEAGYDSWDTVMNITEADMETLGFTRCHRKELKLEIAKSRDTVIMATSSTNAIATRGYDQWSSASDEKVLSVNGTGGAPAKRKYRHRPKHDPNAPERPYSAYVMFSNHMRDELKDQDLTFTAISRTVGTRWQALDHQEKEAWQSQASVQMAKYKAKLTDYHQTESYHQHKAYVGTFKSAQEAKENDRKHARTSSMTKTVSPTVRLEDSESSTQSPQLFGYDPFTPNVRAGASNSGNSLESNTNSTDPSSGRMGHHVSSSSSFGVDQGARRRQDSATIEKYEVLLGKLWPNADHSDRTAIQQGLIMSPYQIHERFGEATMSEDQFSPTMDDTGGGRSTVSPRMPVNHEVDEDTFAPMQSPRRHPTHPSQISAALWYGQGPSNIRDVSSEELNFDNPTFSQPFLVPAADPATLPVMALGNSTTGWNSFVNDLSPLSYQDHFDQYEMPIKTSMADYHSGAFRSLSQTPNLFPSPSDMARMGDDASLEEDHGPT